MTRKYHQTALDAVRTRVLSEVYDTHQDLYMTIQADYLDGSLLNMSVVAFQSGCAVGHEVHRFLGVAQKVVLGSFVSSELLFDIQDVM